MTKDRQELGFAGELEEFDPKAWKSEKPKTDKPRAPSAETRQAAKDAGFQSRPTEGQSRVPKRIRRRRTGRNQQFNIKTTPAAIEEFTEIADLLDWGLGETFEKAIPLLRRAYLDKSKNEKSGEE